MVPQFSPSEPSRERALMSAHSQQLSVAVLAQPASSAAPSQVPRMNRASVFIGNDAFANWHRPEPRTVLPEIGGKVKIRGESLRSFNPQKKKGTAIQVCPLLLGNRECPHYSLSA